MEDFGNGNVQTSSQLDSRSRDTVGKAGVWDASFIPESCLERLDVIWNIYPFNEHTCASIV
ncbi:hypothetical protein KIN20_001026 [Parelaphostrongylus tenuis]|uniref:Uncharacterized protein n=1 Tax=Parelaphostrongylus tenuis TaxID=148309 RepID=A0AAD5QBY4_PARTN|nr:hypothetical protein KIN20_001026 [Parelaphostrongylus tenuis]